MPRLGGLDSGDNRRISDLQSFHGLLGSLVERNWAVLVRSLPLGRLGLPRRGIFLHGRRGGQVGQRHRPRIVRVGTHALTKAQDETLEPAHQHAVRRSQVEVITADRFSGLIVEQPSCALPAALVFRAGAMAAARLLTCARARRSRK